MGTIIIILLFLFHCSKQAYSKIFCFVLYTVLWYVWVQSKQGMLCSSCMSGRLVIDLCTGQTVANKPLTYRRRCEGEDLTMTYELCWLHCNSCSMSAMYLWDCRFRGIAMKKGLKDKNPNLLVLQLVSDTIAALRSCCVACVFWTW